MSSQEVDAYLAGLEPNRREALTELRAIVLEEAPGAVETMKYRMPTYEFHDGVLCAFASQKQYMSLYMDTNLVDEYRADLDGLSVGKSCIRFRKLDKLPIGTVRTMLRETLRNMGSV